VIIIYFVDIIFISIAHIILIKNRNIGIKEPETWAGIIIYILVCIVFSFIFKKIIGKYFKTNKMKTLFFISLISIAFISLIIFTLIIEDINSINEIFTNWENHRIIVNGLFVVLIYANTIIILLFNLKNINKINIKSN
jgi:predicted small integral membrane protein